MPREDTPEQSWFARTGEPAPLRQPPVEPEAPPTSRLAVAVLIAGALFVVAVTAAAIYLGSL